jgi:pentatricopeptide repeat protein
MVVDQLLSDPKVKPNVQVFTALVEAWASSSRHDAADQAFAVLRLIREHPRCMESNIRPNNWFFSALLKCLSASEAPDAGKHAEALLDDMEFQATQSTNGETRSERPDCVTYALAIKACLQAGDLTRADSVMRRMENSPTPPNLHTYNTILQYYAQMGTPAAARRTEDILSYVKRLSQVSNTSPRLNAISYNIALAAWARSGDLDSANRMWRVYQQMQADSVAPSMASYSTLISFFSKSDQKEIISMADIVIRDMTQRNRVEFRPDFRHFNPVLNGFLQINDARGATNTLLRCIELHLRDGNNTQGSKPKRGYFESVTKAWISAGDLISATVFLEKIQELHDSMRLSEGPSREAYRALVTAWEKSDHANKDEYMARLEVRLVSLARNSDG